MHWRVAQSDIDKAGVYFGIGIADTEIEGAISDGIYFWTDHDGNLDYVIEKGNTPTKADTDVDLEDGTVSTKFVECDMFVNASGDVTIFVDGEYITKLDDPVKLPDVEALSIFMGIHNSADQANSLYVDVVDVRQVR